MVANEAYYMHALLECILCMCVLLIFLLGIDDPKNLFFYKAYFIHFRCQSNAGTTIFHSLALGGGGKTLVFLSSSGLFELRIFFPYYFFRIFWMFWNLFESHRIFWDRLESFNVFL